jgi:hypothetical protein
VAVTERPAIYLLGVFYFSRGSMVQEKQSWCCCGGQKENVRVIICLKDEGLKNKGADTRSSSQDQQDAKISSIIRERKTGFSLKNIQRDLSVQRRQACILLSTSEKNIFAHVNSFFYISCSKTKTKTVVH